MIATATLVQTPTDHSTDRERAREDAGEVEQGVAGPAVRGGGCGRGARHVGSHAGAGATTIATPPYALRELAALLAADRPHQPPGTGAPLGVI